MLPLTSFHHDVKCYFTPVTPVNQTVRSITQELQVVLCSIVYQIMVIIKLESFYPIVSSVSATTTKIYIFKLNHSFLVESSRQNAETFFYFFLKNISLSLSR